MSLWHEISSHLCAFLNAFSPLFPSNKGNEKSPRLKDTLRQFFIIESGCRQSSGGKEGGGGLESALYGNKAPHLLQVVKRRT